MRKRERRAGGEISPNLESKSFMINDGTDGYLKQVCDVSVAQELENDLHLAQTLALECITANPDDCSEHATLIEDVAMLARKTRYVLTSKVRCNLNEILPYLEDEEDHIRYYGGFSRVSTIKANNMKRTVEAIKTLLGDQS